MIAQACLRVWVVAINQRACKLSANQKLVFGFAEAQPIFEAKPQ